MELKNKLANIFHGDFPGIENFIQEVLIPVFGDEIDQVNHNFIDDETYRSRAERAGIKSLCYVANITEQNYNAQQIALFDVILDDRVNVERSKVNIQAVIRSIVMHHSHILILFHYENSNNRPWRFSYAYKQTSVADTTSAKRFTYVFGKDYSGRTAAERFEALAASQRSDDDFVKAFSVEALSDEFFKRYRELYADIIEFITGKITKKISNKWVDVPSTKNGPDEKIMTAFKWNEPKVRDYIKKMMGRITFLYFIQRKGWLCENQNFMHELFFNSDKKATFLDDVLEPLFFGVLNTNEDREAVFIKNGWDLSLLDRWKDIKYMNGGLFEQTDEDRVECTLPQSCFKDIFNFFDSYNFTIDENDPLDVEVGIDPEMLGRIFESLLEDNKDKGAFYTPKEIVQYMCKESLKQYLITQGTNAEQVITALINRHEIETEDIALVQSIEAHLKSVKICDPAIGSGAFPMGLLNEILACRRAIHNFIHSNDNVVFDTLAVKREIIRNNIFGVDIEQGAVDIARLRFWLSIVVDTDEPQPLPNLDYTIIKGNSLLTTFQGEHLNLSSNVDRRTRLGRELDQLHRLQEKIYDQYGEPEMQTAIDIKLKLLDIIELQLGLERSDAINKINQTEDSLFDTSNSKNKKKNREAKLIMERKSRVKASIDRLRAALQSPNQSLLKRAQADIDFFDWSIMFSDVFDNGGFDIVIGNPPYIKEYTNREAFNGFREMSPYYRGKMDLWYGFACQAIDHLKPKGVMCFIATNNWVTNTGASILRNKILDDARMLQLIDFKDYMIFEDSASIQTMILLLSRQSVDNYTFEYRKLTKTESKKEDAIKLLTTTKTEDGFAMVLSPLISN